MGWIGTKSPGNPMPGLLASTTWPEMLFVAGMRARLVVIVALLLKVIVGAAEKLATKLDLNGTSE